MNRIINIIVVLVIICSVFSPTLLGATISGEVTYYSSLYSTVMPVPKADVYLLESNREQQFPDTWEARILSKCEIDTTGKFQFEVKPGYYGVLVIGHFHKAVKPAKLTEVIDGHEKINSKVFLKDTKPYTKSQTIEIKNEEENINLELEIVIPKGYEEKITDPLTHAKDKPGLVLYGKILSDGKLVDISKEGIFYFCIGNILDKDKEEYKRLIEGVNLLGGEYAVNINDAGTFRLLLSTEKYLIYTKEIDVTKPEGEMELNINLIPIDKYVLSGTVLNSSGQGIYGAGVTIKDSQGENFHYNASSEGGKYSMKFEIPVHAKIMKLNVTIEKEGYHTITETIDIRSRKNVIQNFVLKPTHTGTITGVVREFTTKETVPKVRVYIREGIDRPIQGGRSYSTKTNEKGHYRIKNILPGEYLIYTWSPYDYAPLKLSEKKVRIDRDQVINGLDLWIAIGGFLEGKIVDEEGQPMSGIFIQGFESTKDVLNYIEFATTGENGEFKIGPMPPGKNILTIYDSPHRPRKELKEIEVTIIPGKTVSEEITINNLSNK